MASQKIVLEFPNGEKKEFEQDFPETLKQVFRLTFPAFGFLNKCNIGSSRDFFNEHLPSTPNVLRRQLLRKKKDLIDNVIYKVSKKWESLAIDSFGIRLSQKQLDHFEKLAKEYILYKLSTQFYKGLAMERFVEAIVREKIKANIKISTNKEDAQQIDFHINKKPISVKGVKYGEHCDNAKRSTVSTQLTYIADKDGAFFDFSKLIEADVFTKRQLANIKKM